MIGETEDRDPEPLRSGEWSEHELDHLRQWYGLKDDQFIARDLARPVPSIGQTARMIFNAAPTNGPWSREDVERLKLYLGSIELEMIGRMIGRSVDSIASQLVELTARLTGEALSGEELVRFKRNYGTRADEDLAIIFGRKLEVVQAKAASLCLSKDKAFLRRASGGAARTKMPRWSDQELDTLRRLYPDHSNLEIAQELERSVKSVVSKAHNMGLKKDQARLQQMGRQNVRQRYGRGRDGTAEGEGPGVEPVVGS